MEISQSDSAAHDVWLLGEAYESYVGRWSRMVALRFLEWLAIPAEKRWLDVGCGTGALTRAILETADPHSVMDIDAAEGFITYARGAVTDSRAYFQPGDAHALPVETAACHVAASGFVLNFLADPARAVLEMARAVKPGGTVAVYVWDYAERVQFMRHFWNAAAALDPAAAGLDEGRRFPLCRPDPLAEVFRSAGLARVEVAPIDTWTVFTDFDDFWSPFLGGQGPAPGYAMTLDEERRTALRERIRAALPVALDGSIPLMARAWAVRGIR